MKKFIKYKLDQERALTPSEPPASSALSSFCPPPEHLASLPPPPPPPSSPDVNSNVFLKREILDFGIRGRIIIQNATTSNISSPGEHFVPICRDFIRGNCYRNDSSTPLPLEHVFKVPALPPLRKRKRSNRSDISSADTSSTKRQRTQKAKHSFCPFPECSEDSDDDSSQYSTLNLQHEKERDRQERSRRKNNIGASIISKNVRILLTPLSPTLCKWLEERTDSRLPAGVVAASVGTR